MSQTILYAAFDDGDLVPKFGFRNSWGSAAMIWQALAGKYLKFDETKDPYLRQFFPSMDDWKRVWDYDNKGGDMKPWERNALRTTYDKTVVTRDAFELCAKSLDMFHEAHGTAISSLAAQAKAIRELHVEGAIAIAWQQNTISEAWMDKVIESDDDGNELDEPVVVRCNVLTGTKHQDAGLVAW